MRVASGGSGATAAGDWRDARGVRDRFALGREEILGANQTLLVRYEHLRLAAVDVIVQILALEL